MAKAGELAAGVSHSSVKFTIMDFVYCLIATIVIYGTALALFMPAVDNGPAPQMFIRLVEVQELLDHGRCARSPMFELAVEVDRVSDSESDRWPCAEDTSSMLRVSYHGIILAWGGVPRFCIDRTSLQGPSVVATAEGSVVREELRNMMRAEINALGSAEFDVEGDLPGFSHLHCKTYLFQGDQTTEEQLPPCRFQKKPWHWHDV